MKLSKEEFIKALEQDTSLFHKCPSYPEFNNKLEQVVLFDDCSYPFSMEEYNELHKKYYTDPYCCKFDVKDLPECFRQEQ